MMAFWGCVCACVGASVCVCALTDVCLSVGRGRFRKAFCE